MGISLMIMVTSAAEGFEREPFAGFRASGDVCDGFGALMAPVILLGGIQRLFPPTDGRGGVALCPIPGFVVYRTLELKMLPELLIRKRWRHRQLPRGDGHKRAGQCIRLPPATTLTPLLVSTIGDPLVFLLVTN